MLAMFFERVVCFHQMRGEPSTSAATAPGRVGNGRRDPYEVRHGYAGGVAEHLGDQKGAPEA